ncbi:hypothetical protein HHE02_02090 [Helicobacter heilmannii]|nr:hypothetical protein HHE02_02090 [Helicobacter heilmannii]CRF50722.1 hypothetical protein HHE06_05660 [Helicobacter heilmannii]
MYKKLILQSLKVKLRTCKHENMIYKESRTDYGQSL